MVGGMATWALVRAGLPWPLAALGALGGGCRACACRRALHLALDAKGRALRAAGELDGVPHPVREPRGRLLGLRSAQHAAAVRQRRLARRRSRDQRAAADRPRLLDRADLGLCRCCSPARRGSGAPCAPSRRIPTPRSCSASTSTASCRWCSSSAGCSRRSPASCSPSTTGRCTRSWARRLASRASPPWWSAAWAISGARSPAGSSSGSPRCSPSTFFGADFVDIAVYGLLLLILIVRPTGLFGGAAPGRAHERVRRGHPGSSCDQHCLRLCGVPADGRRPAQSRDRGLCRDRRLRVGVHQQQGRDCRDRRHSARRARGRRDRARCRGAGAAHARHLSRPRDLRAWADRAGDDPQSRGRRRRRRLSRHRVRPVPDRCGFRRCRGRVRVPAVRHPVRDRGHGGPRRRASRRPHGPRCACIPDRGLHDRRSTCGHRRRSLCASLQLYRGAIFQHLAQHHDRALCAVRRHAERARTAARRGRVHAAAGASARQRAVALCAVRRDRDRRDGGAAPGSGHRNPDPESRVLARRERAA